MNERALPVKSRILLYETLKDGTFSLLDFCIVNTSLGAMIESRTIVRPTSGGMVNEDVYASAYSEIQPADQQTLQSVGFAGSQWPRSYFQA